MKITKSLRSGDIFYGIDVAYTLLAMYSLIIGGGYNDFNDSSKFSYSAIDVLSNSILVVAGNSA